MARRGVLAALCGTAILSARTSIGAQAFGADSVGRLRTPCDSVASAYGARQIARLLDDALTARVAPAMAVGIVQDGHVCFTVSVGAESWAPGARLVRADSTRFDLASLTKVLGPAALAAVAVDDGRIAWGSPLVALGAELGARASQMTFAQLLAHNSGLPAAPRWPVEMVRRGRRKVSRARVPRTEAARWRAVLRTPIVARVGTPLYSDVGANLLWVALGRVFDSAPAAAVRRRVWTPLGMTSTTYAPGHSAGSWGLARSTRDGRVHDPLARLLQAPAGHAGVFATALDVSRFVAELTDPSPRVFSAETQSAMLGALTRSGAFGLVPCRWHHGCGGRFSPSARGHTGYTGTSLWIDRGVGIVLLTNRARAASGVGRFTALHALRRAIADSAMSALVLNGPGGSH